MSKNTAGSTTGVTVGTSSTAIVSANLGRIEITIVNDDATNVVYLGIGVTATANNGIRLNAAGGSFTSNNWKGAITGIAAGSSKVTVMEL